MWSEGVGVAGQEKLKNASVLISRTGGIGSVVAYELAAAGVGKLVIIHGGVVRPTDLNRQLLMTHDSIGRPRIETVRARLLELNPRLEIVSLGEHASAENVLPLAEQENVDVVVDCAPMFAERFALADASLKLQKPMVECGMYDMEAQLTTLIPGETPCLRCLFPETPPTWKREFPVFGAVAGSVGAMAATEVIKLITGVGQPLAGRWMHFEFREMRFRTLKIDRRDDCPYCSPLNPNSHP
ncbi:HesA/MoeB/ThiF family protein [Blastopirellula sp. JC732]|uniref:HesA/MoeB/ThiF family protein n=1 Tax=Blastopirellula sediminis TaxID=2894196 RepID=A0A9X1SFX8_9BACT|nr:HesA/MoeB/ThiF family protein [Blastopirellula sediminis]MCC9628813.1 HesA/MoeB/ThiF family protein [Blastopirellula sediminis]